VCFDVKDEAYGKEASLKDAGAKVDGTKHGQVQRVDTSREVNKKLILKSRVEKILKGRSTLYG
jgi:hypothetical protein